MLSLHINALLQTCILSQVLEIALILWACSIAILVKITDPTKRLVYSNRTVNKIVVLLKAYFF